MVKPPDKSVSEDAASDPDAVDENKNYANLEEIERAKSGVIIAIHRTLAWLVPLALIISFSLLAVGFGIWLLQFLLPHPWLTEIRHHELTTILFSGALGAAISRGLKMYVG